MSPKHRKELLAVMARLEQVIAELQGVIITRPNTKKIVQRAEKRLAESQAMLKEVEWRLREGK